MQEYLTPNLLAGMTAGLLVLLQIATNLRLLFSAPAVPPDKEPLPRSEYAVHHAARDEQIAELRARVLTTEVALHKRVDEACNRLDGLLEALHDLRVEMAGLSANLRSANPQRTGGITACQHPPRSQDSRPRNSG